MVLKLGDESPEVTQQNDDWIKRSYDVPGGPHVQALTILQPGHDDEAENLARFLKLPVARYVPESTRVQIRRMGHDFPPATSKKKGQAK